MGLHSSALGWCGLITTSWHSLVHMYADLHVLRRCLVTKLVLYMTDTGGMLSITRGLS